MESVVHGIKIYPKSVKFYNLICIELCTLISTVHQNNMYVYLAVGMMSITVSCLFINTWLFLLCDVRTFQKVNPIHGFLSSIKLPKKVNGTLDLRLSENKCLETTNLSVT